LITRICIFNRVKEASYNIDQGVGVRAVSGEKTGLAYSNDIVLSALENAASAAKNIALSGKDHAVSFNQNKKIIKPHELYLPINPITSLADSEKIALLHKIDAEARALSPHYTSDGKFSGSV
jgi:TldD protein